MEGLNRVTLLGNLGAPPDLHATQGGQSVLKLRIATNESYFDKNSNTRKEVVEWHRVVVFGNRADALAKILDKGSAILVEGKLKTSSYEKDGVKHYSTDVIATNIVLVGSRRDGGGEQRETKPAARPAAQPEDWG